MNPMLRVVRIRLVQLVSWIVLASVLGSAVALIVVPKSVGGRPLTVLSESMAPTFVPGDVVVVRPADASEFQIGDVITFQAKSGDPQLTTHRIDALAFGSDGTQFVTKGDANNAPDLSPIKPEQVMGEVWYSVPKVGYVSLWINSGGARKATDVFAVGLLLYAGWFIAAGVRDRRRKKNDEIEREEVSV